MRKHLLFLFSISIFIAGCGRRIRKPEDLTLAELKTSAISAVERNRKEEAIAYLEQLISQYPEHQDIFEYKFMLADMYMKVGRLDAAYNLYKHYTELYPSEAKAEEAHYKSILSKFYQTLKVSKDCDDSDTQRAIKQCQAYLSVPLYNAYRNDVKDIRYTCERRLIDKEVYVFNTYMRRKKFQSAKNRIDYLRETFLPKHPTLEAQILYLESLLAQKQKNKKLVDEKVEELFEKFPTSRFTRMAQGVSSKKKFSF